MDYVRRCMALSREFWYTLIFATAALVVCQGLQLAAPNLQGRIIDAISHGVKEQYMQAAAMANHRHLLEIGGIPGVSTNAGFQQMQAELEVGADPAFQQVQHLPFPLGGVEEYHEPAFATCDADSSLLWTTGFFMVTGDAVERLTDSAST